MIQADIIDAVSRVSQAEGPGLVASPRDVDERSLDSLSDRDIPVVHSLYKH